MESSSCLTRVVLCIVVVFGLGCSLCSVLYVLVSLVVTDHYSMLAKQQREVCYASIFADVTRRRTCNRIILLYAPLLIDGEFSFQHSRGECGLLNL